MTDDLLKSSGLIVFGLMLVLFLIIMTYGDVLTKPKQTKHYEIICAVLTQGGPSPTIKTEATNVRMTDAGVIIADEGMYIPTTNEMCIVREKK